MWRIQLLKWILVGILSCLIECCFQSFLKHCGRPHVASFNKEIEIVNIYNVSTEEKEWCYIYSFKLKSELKSRGQDDNLGEIQKCCLCKQKSTRGHGLQHRHIHQYISHEENFFDRVRMWFQNGRQMTKHNVTHTSLNIQTVLYIYFSRGCICILWSVQKFFYSHIFINIFTLSI